MQGSLKLLGLFLAAILLLSTACASFLPGQDSGQTSDFQHNRPTYGINSPGSPPQSTVERGWTEEFQNPGQGNRPGFNQDRRIGGGNIMPGNGTSGRGIASGGTKYALPLITYAFVFFSLLVLAFYGRPRKVRMIRESDVPVILLALLAVGLFLRIVLATGTGHPYDLRLFQSWATAAAQNLFQVYEAGRSSDYPPLYIYVLALIGQAGKIAFLQPYFTVLLKLPSLLADLLTSLLLYKLAAKRLSPKAGLGLASFYLFNPAIFINSAVWGQADSFFTLLIVGAVFLLAENKPVLSSLLFAAGVLMKPQGIIFLPVLFFELWRRRSLRLFMQSAAAALLTAVVVVLPFAMHFGPFWIFSLFLNTLSEYPYASLNAFNFYSLLGANYVRDDTTLLIFSYHTWGMIAIVGLTLLTWYLYQKKKNALFGPSAALLLMAGVFMFSARMHERYLFPVVALAVLAFIYWQDKRLLLLAAGFSLTVYANTHYILYRTGLGGSAVGFDLVTMLISFINLGLFTYLVKILWDIVITQRNIP